MMKAGFIACMILVASGCHRGPSDTAGADAGAFPRRWPKPPPSAVRAYPPHAIRSDGVGPYLLDATLSDVLHSLPDGPRVELVQLGRLVNWRVVRAEAGQLLVGADHRNRVAFVAVLAPEIAITASGVGVGSTGDQLLEALGREVDHDDLVRDRRIFEFASLPGVRFLTDVPSDTPASRARVTTVVVARPDVYELGHVGPGLRPEGADRRDRDKKTGRGECRSGGLLATVKDEIAQAARGRSSQRGLPLPVARPLLRFGCLTSQAPEAVAIGPGELTIVGGEPGKLRRIYQMPLAVAHFVFPLDVDRDGRDELVIGAHERGDSSRSVELRVLRWEGSRLLDLARESPFLVSEASASAAGVRPGTIDFLVEVVPTGSALLVRGYYMSISSGRVREVAPVTPLTLRLEPRRAISAGPALAP
ncbi:MAG: hypothetical protein HY698_16605 [Deltaproteobacteria bacterium]|nr:hypothetical protein [Deltaproteobacteria bacterium]